MSEDLPDHAENSPSSSEAWSTCADYINANRGLLDETSWQAAEGTMAHTIREECLQTGQDAVEFVGMTFAVEQFSFTWSDDDAMLLQPGIDRLRATPGKFFGEHRVDLTEWLGHDTKSRPQGGTLDAGIIGADGVTVDDLKFGRGVPVRPHANKQLQLYALGFGREHNITDPRTPFVLRIDQPRNMSGGGEWRTTWGDLLEFGIWIRERADATRAPNPPRTASNAACMWCRRKIAKGSCATFETYIMDLLGMELEDLDAAPLTLPTGLTPARRRTLIEHSKMITTWLEQMEEAALADALAGADAGGLKPVYGRKAPDAWLDGKAAEAAVAPILGARTFNQRLITPTQCAKQIPEDSFDRLLIEPLIKRGERKPVLAPPEDERPPIVTAKQIAELDDL